MVALVPRYQRAIQQFLKAGLKWNRIEAMLNEREKYFKGTSENHILNLENSIWLFPFKKVSVSLALLPLALLYTDKVASQFPKQSKISICSLQ